jgi:citronellyl-CoA synthetase
MSFLNEAFSSAKVVVSELLPVIYRSVVNRPSDEGVDNIPLRLSRIARMYPDKIAVIFEDRRISWSELDERASRIAQALSDKGIQPGQCVSLLMDNRIEFLESWFGVMRLGAIASLINTNLHGAQLSHCINMSGAGTLILGSEHSKAVAEIKEDCNLEEGKDFLWIEDITGSVTEGVPNWAVSFSQQIEQTDPMPEIKIPATMRKAQAMYIFTSGTTGLPKASVQKHSKIVNGMDASRNIGLKLVADDVLYVCLPLYHATGLLIGFTAALNSGATVFLKRKFSASHFLDDVRENNCNAFIYIGELCRYLLAQPEQPDDGDNPLVKITGNGLRPDIWMEFKSRFKIEKIIEFYGASEGNTGFLNLFNRDRTIGTAIIPPALVEYDVENDLVVRDEGGRCRRVKKGEVGLLLGPITPATEFAGYTDSEATEKKVLHDVFKEGDAYFNTGDLIRTVDAGFSFGFKHYQFVDRIGDTFRWKGENCSTNEIGEIINQHTSIDICNVFGVDIPGTDGKAGMAAVVLKEGHGFDQVGISALISDNLASYARPVFIRVLSEQQLTGTFKLQKNELRSEAYHPDRSNDPIYVLQPGASHYELLDETFCHQILAGEAGY